MVMLNCLRHSSKIKVFYDPDEEMNIETMKFFLQNPWLDLKLGQFKFLNSLSFYNYLMENQEEI